jgi:hypothetical protein
MNDSLKTNILPAPRTRRAWKAAFVVAVMIASSMAAVGTASAAGVCSITVNQPVVTPLHIAVDGDATYNGPQANIFSFTVNWGDGVTEDIPVQADPFTWSVSHDYTTAGPYTVSIEMIHAQQQGQDTCAGAYSASVDVPPPPGPEICGNGVDDNGDGQIDEGCPTPPPPAEICGNGIDDNNNGVVDENCPTGGTTGGTHSSGGTKVLAKTATKQAPLATTGAATTAAAWLGAMMLMAGLAMRFIRPRPVRAVFAGQGSVAADVLWFGISLQSRSYSLPRA